MANTGMLEAFGLFHGVGLLLHVHYEQSGGKAGQVSDRTEVLLEFGALTADLEFLSLGEVVKSAIGSSSCR